MTRYRICHVQGHKYEYWTVEQEVPHLIFGKKWVLHGRCAEASLGFRSEAAAMRYIAELKPHTPETRSYGEPL